MNTENPLKTARLADTSWPAGSKTPARILVVDANADLCRLNTELLLNAGYSVDHAENGETAWDELQSNYYDLLVTDNHMRKLSGICLLKKLHVAGMDMPVIFVTGEAPTAELARYPWLQIEAVLLKPYAAADLLAVVSNVLRAIDSTAGLFALPPGLAVAPMPIRLQL